MAANERINISMQVDNNDAKTRLKEMQREMQQMQRNMDGNVQSAQKLGAGLSQVKGQTDMLSGAAMRAGQALAGMFSIAGAVALLGKLKEIEAQQVKIAGQRAQSLTNVLALTGEARQPERAEGVRSMVDDIIRTTKTKAEDAIRTYGIVRGELTQPGQEAQADELTRLTSSVFENVTDQKVRDQMTKSAAIRLSMGPGQNIEQVLAEVIVAHEGAGNNIGSIESSYRRIQQSTAFGDEAVEMSRLTGFMSANLKGVDQRGASISALQDRLERRGEFGMGHLPASQVAEMFLKGDLSVERLSAGTLPADMVRMLKTVQSRTAENFAAMEAVTPAILEEFRSGTRGTLGAQAGIEDQEVRKLRMDRERESIGQLREQRAQFASASVREALGGGYLAGMIGGAFYYSTYALEAARGNAARARGNAFEERLGGMVDLNAADKIFTGPSTAGGGRSRTERTVEKERVEVTIRIEAPEGLPVQAAVASGGD